MRYVLKLEAIGDNHAWNYRQMRHTKTPYSGQSSRTFERRQMEAYRLGRHSLQPWVARITGIDAQGRIERQFLKAQKDYSQANSTGSRGVWFYYALTSGCYEVQARETWARSRRYYLQVIDASTAHEISQEGVVQCLANASLI